MREFALAKRGGAIIPGDLVRQRQGRGNEHARVCAEQVQQAGGFLNGKAGEGALT